MANAPRNARPVADNVDPATPQPSESVDDTPKTVTGNEASTLSEAGAERSKENAARQDAQISGDKGDDVPAGSAPFVSGEKVTVKTTGNFNLMDPFTGQTIDANSEGEEVRMTQFIRDKIETGELEEA